MSVSGTGTPRKGFHAGTKCGDRVELKNAHMPLNVVHRSCARPVPVMLSWLVLFLAHLCPGATDEFPTATWKTARPESQGLDSGVLADMLEYVRTKGIPAHSLLIVRNGVMVLDAYFYPYTGRELHDVASVTKSFTSAAVGNAIEKGYIKSIDQKVLSLLPAAPAVPDLRKETLSIRHLLTMTSGFDCDTEGGEKALAEMRHSTDWAAFALALPMRADPGSRYAYLQLQQSSPVHPGDRNDGRKPFRLRKEQLVSTDRYQRLPLAFRLEWPYARMGRPSFARARHGENGPPVPASRPMAECPGRSGRLGARFEQGERDRSIRCRLRIQLVD
jgi:hypothetical protein